MTLVSAAFTRILGTRPAFDRTRLARVLSAGLAVVALVSAGSEPAAAQLRKPLPVKPTMVNDAGQVVEASLPARSSSAFELFALEDQAFGGLNMTGRNGFAVYNFGGPCPVYSTSGGPYLGYCQQHNNVSDIYFEMGFIGGVGPTDFRKIRAVHPAVGTMRGSFGYNVASWNRITGTVNQQRWNAADGQFGRLFAGVTSTEDASCRNINNGQNSYNPGGFTMLAMQDCPDTWPSAGFQGKLVVPDSVWRARFAANPANFNWNDWEIPTSNLDPTNFLGANSTYGVVSDYFREQKIRYGSVVPGGSGAPQLPGFPMGLELRVDAFQFSSPGVRNAMFYQVTMVNKSADVYGTGVDFDSVYFGLAPGFVGYGQRSSGSVDFSRNVFLYHGGNIKGNCSATYPRRYVNASTAGCQNTSVLSAGVNAIQWLKSPLGDMRNKLFSDPASPYYNPSSPLADDTITFNHIKTGGLGLSGQTIAFSDRSGFGAISSTEENYLDGRSLTDFGTPGTVVTAFAPEVWNGAVDPATTKFNKFVPGATVNPITNTPYGSWDYNNDGRQDSISVPQCGRFGCSVIYSDTNAGGYRQVFDNIQNTMTAGPFALGAGDTTQFLFTFTWAPDTVVMHRELNQIIQSYLTNYAGPTAITFPALRIGQDIVVESAELRDSVINRAGSATGSTPGRVIIRPPTIPSADLFLQREVARIRQDSINGDANVRRLLRLNPGLLNQISARAADNLSEILIFKSCDNGVTFTTGSGISGIVGQTGTTCRSADTRNIDAGGFAFEYRPRFRVEYINGVPQTASLTDEVQAGRSYLYSFVTRSRGLRDIQVVDSVGGQLVATDLSETLGLPIDTLYSSLTRSGPTAATIYVPVSLPAARSFARIDTATAAGVATQRVTVGDVINSASGRYRTIFANQFIVRTTVDTTTRVTSTTVQARVLLPAATQTAGQAGTSNFVAREYTFTTPAVVPIRTGTAGTAGADRLGTLRSTVGSVRTFVDTINSAAGRTGFVLVNDSTRAALFIASEQYLTGLAGVQVASPLFPGFTVTLPDSANATTGFRTEFLERTGTTRDRNFVLRCPANQPGCTNPTDTMTVDARQFVPQFVPAVLAPQRRIRGGTYELTWLADPFGPLAPFTLTTRQQTDSVVNASLRTVAAAATTITETSATVASMVGVGPTSPRQLARVRIPFTVTFRDARTGALDTVRFAMLQRQNNTRLLGSGADTIRITVPDTLWLPGDTLIALQRVERDSSVVVGTTRYTVVAPSTVNGVTGFSPIRVTADSIGFGRFFVACNTGANYSGVRPASDAATCNPLVTLSRGSSPQGGYLPVAPGWKQVFEIARTFEAGDVLALTATPFSTANAVTQQSIEKVRVVPNPYVVRSEFDQIDDARTATARLLFTGVPEVGTVRIYSISGQLVQELTWTRQDLENIGGNGQAVGDLPWNLRSREGLDVGSGLYIYVLTASATDGGDRIQTRGKFAIIR